MSYQRLFVGLLVLLMQADLSAFAQTLCGSNGNYTTNSAYSANLNTALSTNIDNDGFNNASTGQGPNRVNAVALCRGDVQLNACRQCVQKTGDDLVDSCPFQKEGTRWDQFCTLRYSNETVYGAAANNPKYSFYNGLNATNPDQFRADDKGRTLIK